MMDKELLQFKGVYGEHEPPFWDTAVYMEPVIKRSQVYNFEINEHLHVDLVQVFVLDSGGGTLLSEGKQIPLHTPCVVFIPVGVLHGFMWESSISGTVITVSLSYLENLLAEHQNTLVQFQQLQYLDYEQSDIEFQEMIYLKESLDRELKALLVGKHHIIHMLMNLMMAKLYRKSIVQNQQTSSKNNRHWIHYNAFQKSITQNINTNRRVAHYAMDLNITTVHLNRICQSLVGKSALQIIHEKLITKAKKHLLYTSLTIAEVSYKLNFKDPSHFSKFFKKMVGVGPRKFRNSQDGGG